MIPYGRQNISGDDIESVVSILKSDFLTQGPVVPQFEEAICRYVRSQYSVATNSATSALHLACLALGVNEKSVVWTSPISFVASANCAHYCGAKVDFVDIDLKTFNICVDALEAKLNKARDAGTLPSVVIVVHLAGRSCDMGAIARLSKKFGFRVIEDASHAFGATYDGEPVGSCKHCDIAVFSFHPVKMITTGEGGAAVTNNRDFALKMQLLRSHGITRNVEEMTQVPDGPWYYQQKYLGYNYRMSDIQAALGLSQLMRLDDFLEKRREIVDIYETLLASSSIIKPDYSARDSSSWHLYIIRIPKDGQRATRNITFQLLRNSGIGVNLHYIPIYRHPYYDRSIQPEEFPNAEKYYESAITLPIFPGLKESDVAYVVEILESRPGYQTLF